MHPDTRKADALDAVGQFILLLALIGLTLFAAWAFLESDEHGVLPADSSFFRDMARLAAGLWPL
jgi:hypothetical protein